MTASRMDKAEVPRSSGIFKPVDHVVLAMPDADSSQAARAALADGGFDAQDVIHYRSDEMRELVDDDLRQAGALASMGSEISLARRHRQLAESGFEFLVVYAPDEGKVATVADVARRCGAHLAQRYGHLAIEELIKPIGETRA